MQRFQMLYTKKAVHCVFANIDVIYVFSKLHSDTLKTHPKQTVSFSFAYILSYDVFQHALPNCCDISITYRQRKETTDAFGKIIFCKCKDACNLEENKDKKNKENVIGDRERRICWEHYATSSKPLNVRRTVVTKATQSIYTWTTASLVHCKNNYKDKKQPKKIDKCQSIIPNSRTFIRANENKSALSS